MGLIDRFTGWMARSATIPPWPPAVDNFWPYANLNGTLYPLDDLQLTMPGSREEEIEANFTSFVQRGFKGNSVVFALMRDRMALFSQAQFQFRNLRTGKTFGNESLTLLEHPWPNGTTADLLARAITDVDVAGNFYATLRGTRAGRRIKRMHPPWVTMVFGSDDPDVTANDLDAEFLGIIYYPGGEYGGGEPVYLRRDEIAHFAPIPDPEAHVRGMSWITPVVREIMGDSAATSHKLRFFENAGTPNMVIQRTDAPSKESFEEWRTMIRAGHQGAANAYKWLFLTNGATATPIGRDMQQLEFKATQGAGETRMAAASGIHPVIAGLSEGLAGSSLNQGNFGAARRLVADKTLWWLWTNFCGSMETLIKPPAGSQLWINADHMPFLREDRKDAAEILKERMLTIESGIRAGYEPESVVAAVDAEDLSLLKHTGLYSVQLQPPGTTTPEPTAPVEATPPPANGKPKPTPAGAP